MHKSIATIDSPEFINLQPLDINPLMSQCEIKVLYLGENRNRSYITEEVAADMAKTLRGAPIVGYYKEEKEDFRDHGEKMILDDEGIKFECLTKPYGFVAPDAKVWFQNFEDTDEFGNTITRKYLMTTGYLWTGQFKEAKLAIEEGRPQSMELDDETLQGNWATNNKTGMDFFIINDAIFSKLCILGDDVEPCFEGASVTAPEVSTSFTKLDDTFKQTLFTMMQDLKFALEGGKTMDIDVNEATEEITTIENNDTEVVEVENQEENVVETVEEVVPVEESIVEENQSNQEEENKGEEEQEDTSEEVSNEETEDVNTEYALLKEQFSNLQNEYSALENKYNVLVEFKNNIENEKKDNLIKSFYMLSDEDKAEVIANKTQYSLDEIEAKLSVICVRKRVNFESSNEEESQDNNGAVVTTFNYNDVENNVPAWISAVRDIQKQNKNI